MTIYGVAEHDDRLPCWQVKLDIVTAKPLDASFEDLSSAHRQPQSVPLILALLEHFIRDLVALGYLNYGLIVHVPDPLIDPNRLVDLAMTSSPVGKLEVGLVDDQAPLARLQGKRNPPILGDNGGHHAGRIPSGCRG